MKMRITAIILALVCLLMLASCGCKHQWIAPNCTTPTACSLCGKTEGTPADHSWNAASCSAPRTCLICGTTQGEALSHTWQNATCTQAKTCLVCGKTDGEALSHTWQNATCTQAETCLVCGITEGTATGHNWIAATTTNPKTCSVCGETEGSPILDIVAGDTITMGYYGNEEIVWIVLEFDPATNQALLISKYCIDAIPFHAGSDYGSWENSTLRRWLNNNFISTAFSQEERARILTKCISTPNNADYGTSSGNDTYDRVFLLSYEEAVYYFPSQASRQGTPTAYCRAQGCYDPVKYAQENGTEVDPDTIGHTWWWLRTAGLDEKHTCNVVSKGTASTYGAYQTSNEGTVRPAMWVQLG